LIYEESYLTLVARRPEGRVGAWTAPAVLATSIRAWPKVRLTYEESYLSPVAK
jgi:hypothetical protein